MPTYRVVLTGLFLLLFTLLAGCSQPEARPGNESPGSEPAKSEDKRIASADVVKVSPQPTEIPAGGSGDALVRLTIQNGYHINANPPTYPYLKATQLEIPPTEGISSGSVIYPSPLNRTFPFAEKPLAVYEGEAELKAVLKADKTAKKGERVILAKLHIQACDDQVCYPPGTIDLQIPVNIK